MNGSGLTKAVVYRPGLFGIRMFLRLLGPFQYPDWTSDVEQASIMTPGIASTWAQALGATSDKLERVVRL